MQFSWCHVVVDVGILCCLVPTLYQIPPKSEFLAQCALMFERLIDDFFPEVRGTKWGVKGFSFWDIKCLIKSNHTGVTFVRVLVFWIAFAIADSLIPIAYRALGLLHVMMCSLVSWHFHREQESSPL